MESEIGRTAERERRSILKVMLGSAVLAIALLGLTLYLVQRHWGVGLLARPFDRAAWTAPDRYRGDRPARRERMVRNLVKRHLRIGMTRGEVDALMGPGDSDPVLSLREPGEWVYMLGATFMGSLRIVAWGLSDSDVDSPGGMEGAMDAFEIRALRLDFDDQDLLEGIEIQTV